METNGNNQHLLDFADEFWLVNLNLQYSKEKKLYRITYPDGIKAQLEHNLLNKKLGKSYVKGESKKYLKA